MDELEGEFWIIDGSASYADGDVGDINHEGMVIEHMQYMVANKCGVQFENDGRKDWEDVLKEIAEQGDTGMAEDVMTEAGITEEEQKIANGNGNPRLYGMETLGWKRLVDDTIETWTLTKDDIDSIVSGLYDAYPEQFCEDKCWNIYVASTGESYEVTIAELEAMGKPEAERPQGIGADLENQAATQYARGRDAQSMPSFYKGRLGD